MADDDEEKPRPKGINRSKLEENNASNTVKLTKKLSTIEGNLAEGNSIFKMDSNRMKIENHENGDIALLKMLGPNSSKFRKIIADFLKRGHEISQGKGDFTHTLVVTAHEKGKTGGGNQ